MTPIPLTIRSSSSRRRFRVSNKQYGQRQYNIICNRYIQYNMQQIYPGPKDKCVSRSVCPTCGEPGYTALLCDALASTTRRMTRGHPFGHFMNILYCEASRSPMCVKTHAHTCRRACNSKDLHIIRKASRMRYADAASHASPHYILPPYACASPRRRQSATKQQKTFQHAETQNTTYGQPASRVARPQPIAAYRGPHHIEIRRSIIHDKHDKRRNGGNS